MATEAPSKHDLYQHRYTLVVLAMMISAVAGFGLLLLGIVLNAGMVMGGFAMLIVSTLLSFSADALIDKRDREWNTGWFQVTCYAWVSVHNERATDHVLKLAKPGVAGLNPVTLWMGEREVICRRPDQGLMDQLVAGRSVYGRLRYSDRLGEWELEALPIPGE
ncbi:MAG: hypothetical protein WBP14_00125 [Candidatus Saccharimonas aalborgensis]